MKQHGCFINIYITNSLISQLSKSVTSRWVTPFISASIMRQKNPWLKARIFLSGYSRRTLSRNLCALSFIDSSVSTVSLSVAPLIGVPARLPRSRSRSRGSLIKVHSTPSSAISAVSRQRLRSLKSTTSNSSSAMRGRNECACSMPSSERCQGVCPWNNPFEFSIVSP